MDARTDVYCDDEMKDHRHRSLLCLHALLHGTYDPCSREDYTYDELISYRLQLLHAGGKKLDMVEPQSQEIKTSVALAS